MPHSNNSAPEQTQSDSHTAYKNWPNDAAFESSVEHREPIELKVIGRFPAEVTGTLFRNGPSSYKVDSATGGYSRSHWFDGFAQLHRFEIIRSTDGTCRVLYTSRRQVDALVEEARRTGDLKYISFGQKRDPCETFFHKVKTVFQPTAPPSNRPELFNVGVTVVANMPGMLKYGPADSKDSRFKVLSCLTDANQISHAHPETLEPVAASTQQMLHPDLKGPMTCAHPQYDPITGDLYNFNLNFGPKATYRIFKTSAATSKTEIIATLSDFKVKPAYLHSFFLTTDYVVFCIWPAYFKGFGASILWERNILDAMEFSPDSQTQWFVIDRSGKQGVISRFTSPAFFAFHSINAYQENHDGVVDVICDIVQYPNMDILHHTYYDGLLSTHCGDEPGSVQMSSSPRTARYRLPNVSQKRTNPRSAEKVFEMQTGDLPAINPRFVNRRARYHYCTVSRGYSSFVDAIGKVDMETQEMTVWGREPAPHTPGEAVFIPDGTDEAEDAGYLLSVVLNGESGTSYLVCLDARTMTEIGRAECDHAISIGLHGKHYHHEE
ncbi:hypothetical protein FE257_011408 [Aspergillus nanangensis]|uniref:Uncharacterized protein n=1 Tax=Aspergillus nanangensis TaxID=2582783 RepID=A0AAD4CHD6_ASPNN|nr:hypothetical protein FE257_011408 [Aspergillus nanangensis]